MFEIHAKFINNANLYPVTISVPHNYSLCFSCSIHKHILTNSAVICFLLNHVEVMLTELPAEEARGITK